MVESVSGKSVSLELTVLYYLLETWEDIAIRNDIGQF